MVQEEEKIARFCIASNLFYIGTKIRKHLYRRFKKGTKVLRIKRSGVYQGGGRAPVYPKQTK